MDRQRPKKASNQDWEHPDGPEARITKMKDGRTHLAHKLEQAVDLETEAIVAVQLCPADQRDITSLEGTVLAAQENLLAVATDLAATEQLQAQPLQELVVDKGYHRAATIAGLERVGIRR